MSLKTLVDYPLKRIEKNRTSELSELFIENLHIMFFKKDLSIPLSWLVIITPSTGSG